jgi:tRNA dimethylallyltransferase
MKKPLVIISGPTACGKTSVSIELAKLMNGEIISADSMQVYKHMDIGTAKVAPNEMQGIKHYLIDVLEPDEPFSVAVFQDMAKKALGNIYLAEKTPILVGGTGFYTNALVYDNNFMSTCDDENIRNYYENILAEKGNDYLYSLLQEADPEYAKVVHKNNIKRVIKALVHIKEHNETFSEYNRRESQREASYDVKWFILNMDREHLYNRIDIRVDQMIENGLVDEVKSLYPKYGAELISMQGLGYKEIITYLNGDISLDYAIYMIKRDTRHFAKRQITWFRNKCNGVWIDVESYNNSKELALDLYNKYL